MADDQHKRVQRVQRELFETLSHYLQHNLPLPLPCYASVSAVDVAYRALHHAAKLLCNASIIAHQRYERLCAGLRLLLFAGKGGVGRKQGPAWFLTPRLYDRASILAKSGGSAALGNLLLKSATCWKDSLVGLNSSLKVATAN